ncbi:TPR domain protein, putative component of TonB system [uncultured Gammaproteobacteria bacterium]|nr:TPR domain protein, putative component of TonB system [uncultured Gammaproteobacteria bacterium]
MTAYIDYSMVFGDYDNFKTYDNMGYAYGELKEYQKAIGAYKAAIKIKPNKHETYYNMGNAYRKLKEYQKAIDAYKAAIKIKPDYHKAKRSLKQLKALVLTL